MEYYRPWTIQILGGGGILRKPNSRATHSPRPGPEVKNGKRSAIDGVLNRLRLGQSRGGELDPAVNVRRRYKKKSPLRGGVVRSPLTSGGPKWRGNFSEASDHPVIPNRLDTIWNRILHLKLPSLCAKS